MKTNIPSYVVGRAMTVGLLVLLAGLSAVPERHSPVAAAQDSATGESSVTDATLSAPFVHFLPVVFLTSLPPQQCSPGSFGTMLIDMAPNGYIMPADVLFYADDVVGIRGMAGAGAPSDYMRDEVFSRLDGWTRVFLRGTYAGLENAHSAAAMFDMENMYECLAYGPESAYQAGEEALDPLYWVPRAKSLADAAGKCLIYGPAIKDLERVATPEGEDQPREELLEQLVGDITHHLDIWMIQLGRFQLWVDSGHDADGNPYTMQDFAAWMAKWTGWIRAANPDVDVWVQLGIGRHDPIRGVCLPPQPPEYILEYRAVLEAAGVDGIFVMPSQHCMPCPPSPPPGFICSTDPQDHTYYQQSLETFQDAIEMACTECACGY
jgi:hypothetical protein